MAALSLATDDIDRALVASAFAQAAEHGWRRLSLVGAARAAGIAPDIARARIPGRCALLLRFGTLADAHALCGAASDGLARDRLFDLLMRRIDYLQCHRAGVLALLHALPTDPAAALLLASASLRSMGWMLDGAGIANFGPLGGLRAQALLVVWLWTLRAWERDTTEDLAPSMAALDRALSQAERAGAWLKPRPRLPPDAALPADAPPQSAAPPSSEGAANAE